MRNYLQYRIGGRLNWYLIILKDIDEIVIEKKVSNQRDACKYITEWCKNNNLKKGIVKHYKCVTKTGKTEDNRNKPLSVREFTEWSTK